MRLETGADGYFSLDLTFDPGWKIKPAGIKVCLPANVVIDGKEAENLSGTGVELPIEDYVHLQGLWMDQGGAY